MISDTLFEAIQQIEEYQRDGGYEGWQHRIEPVKRAMRELQRDLDVLPCDVFTSGEDIIRVTPAGLVVRKHDQGEHTDPFEIPLQISDVEKLLHAITTVLANPNAVIPSKEKTS